MEKISTEDMKRLNAFAMRALSTVPTIVHSYTCARDVVARGIQGDLVECGVFAGAQCAAMALGSGFTRTVHLFDSFAGIPKAGPNDDHTITDLIGVGNGELESTGISACSEADVRGHMKQWGIPEARLQFHAGWFEESLAREDLYSLFPEGIAVLRLDGDLYSSTRVCLERLYPRLRLGGYCIIDDGQVTGAMRAVSDYFKGKPPKWEHVTGGEGPLFWIRE